MFVIINTFYSVQYVCMVICDRLITEVPVVIINSFIHNKICQRQTSWKTGTQSQGSKVFLALWQPSRQK